MHCAAIETGVFIQFSTVLMGLCVLTQVLCMNFFFVLGQMDDKRQNKKKILTQDFLIEFFFVVN
jgi:hypothetical protein